MNEYVTLQFYLRGFRDPATAETGGPWVWVADLREGAVELRAPKNGGATVRSSSVPEGPGSRGDATEELLSKIESAMAPVIGKLLGGDLDLTGRELAELLFFAAVLVTRVPPFRNTVEHTIGDIVRVLMKVDGSSRPQFQERIREVIPPSLTSDKADEARRMALDDETKVRDGSKVVSLATRVEQASQTIYPIFNRMHWTILTPPGDRHLITSDRPVSWADPTAPPMFESGLCARNVEVFFAVGPTVGLLGRWHGSFGPAPTGSDVIDRANRRQVMFADRYAFADNQETAIRALEMRCRMAGRRQQTSQ